MMTKWDTIQADVVPVIPSTWLDDEEELEDSEMLSLDELLKDEEELVLEWEGLE